MKDKLHGVDAREIGFVLCLKSATVLYKVRQFEHCKLDFCLMQLCLASVA